MLKLSEFFLSFLIAVSFVVYTVSTFVGSDFMMDLTSPIIVAFVLALLISELPRLGPFKKSTFAMILGISLWFVGDVLYLVSDFIQAEEESLTVLADRIYLYPDACFAICISIYMISELRKNKLELALLMTNTLCFAIIGFVVIYRLHLFLAGASNTQIHYEELFFFFVSFYNIMMCVQLFIRIGKENLFKGTNFTIIGILGYATLDIYYDFMLALGNNPENIYLNLFYVLFIVLLVTGTTIQIYQEYEFSFKSRDFSKAATKRRFIIMSTVLLLDIIAMATGFLPLTFGLIVVITILSYLITNYVMYSERLDQLMIVYEREQNSILEKKIEEKTKDLAKANEDLRILSVTDVLTGLQNRRSSISFLNELSFDALHNGNCFAIFCIDLNHFKPVNDTYGHEIGDKVLAEFGKRLKELPPRYHCFRVGGDEFLACFTDVLGFSEVEEAADVIRNLFNTPIIYENYIFVLSASIGVAIFPRDTRDYEQLLSYGDAAMYEIKNSRNKDGYKFFDSKMTTAIEKQYSIAKAVKSSVPEEDFMLYYQPQVDTDSGEILGVEIYPHLKGEMESVSPSDLIPIAEEAGIMTRLGIWIVKEAFETISNWNKKYDLDMGFSINLSPLQLLDAELIEALETLGNQYGIDKGKVILDISNEVIVGASGSARDTMEALHNFGYKLSLNDFGGNNINLSYLMDCGINCIELSRKLIAVVEKDEKTKTLIESIIKFATTMGIDVSAVGIETKSQFELLKSMGVRKMQGYLLCKPVNHDAFEEVISGPLKKIIV